MRGEEPGAESAPSGAEPTSEPPDLRPRWGLGARSTGSGSRARLHHRPCALRQGNLSGAQLLSCGMGITERVPGVVARTKCDDIFKALGSDVLAHNSFSLLSLIYASFKQNRSKGSDIDVCGVSRGEGKSGRSLGGPSGL